MEVLLQHVVVVAAWEEEGERRSDAASHRVVEPLGATKRNFAEGWRRGRGTAAPSCPSPFPCPTNAHRSEVSSHNFQLSFYNLMMACC